MKYLLLCCSLTLLAGEDWHQWRGPQRDGSASFTLPKSLAAEVETRWHTEIGSSYASPVVAGDAVFTLTSVGNKEVISSHDLNSGKRNWQYSYEVDFKANPYATRYGNGPFATPLVADGHLITVGVTGKVSCLALETGKLVWQHQFDGLLNDDRKLFCGNSVSPLQVGDTVVVHLGNEHKGVMTAFGIRDGKTRWSWDGDLPGYVSPLLARLNGQQQLISMTQNKVVGIHPQSGKLLWEHPYQVDWRENIVAPIVYKDQVIVSGREQHATTALKIQDGKPQIAWENKETFMYISSPILLGDRLIGMSHRNKGTLFAMDPSSGKVLWESEGRQGLSMSLVHNGSEVIALNDSGSLTLLDGKANEFTSLARYQLGQDASYAHPVPVKGGLLVHTGKLLKRISF